MSGLSLATRMQQIHNTKTNVLNQTRTRSSGLRIQNSQDNGQDNRYSAASRRHEQCKSRGCQCTRPACPIMGMPTTVILNARYGGESLAMQRDSFELSN